MSTYRAAMDIGTNSCRLIVAEILGDRDHTHLRQIRITRIGEGLGRGDLLISIAAMDRTISALIEYKAMIEAYPIDRVRLLGTQALREAGNAQEFAAKVKARTGFDLEIISGRHEAFLSYSGAVSGLKGPGLAWPLVLDIGAGSTELFWEDGASDGERRVAGASAPIGALRLLERPLDDQGIREALMAGWEYMAIPSGVVDGTGEAAVTDGAGTAGVAGGAAVAGADGGAGTVGVTGGVGEAAVAGTVGVTGGAGVAGVASHADSERPLVAVGGTATTLGAIHIKMKVYDPEALLGLRMSRAEVADVVAMLEGLPMQERLALPGMMPGREDVMPWGLRILLGAMDCCGRGSVVICDRDLLYGALYE